MPTTRPRHVITETEQVARALDEAAQVWPEDAGNRTKLLRHLLDEGSRVVTAEHERRMANRRAVVAETSGALTGIYGEGYLDTLREDWPE